MEISFELSNECLLRVTARELATGREVSSTFSTRDSPETVKAKLNMLEQAAAPHEAEGTDSQPVEQPAVAAKSAAGPVGWIKRLFGER